MLDFCVQMYQNFISTHQWNVINTFNCHLTSHPKILLMNITQLKLYTTESSIFEIQKGMNGLPQTGKLQMTYFKSTWISTYFNLLSSPQDSGPTNIDPFTSPSLLITLESSMLESNMQSVSFKHSKNYTKSQSIGKGNFILLSVLSGITRGETCIYINARIY